MNEKRKACPTDWDSWLSGVFWQQWEIEFNGDPVKALKFAGYPDERGNPASKAIAELLEWIEHEANLKQRFPSLNLLYDYESNGLTLIEFLVLTKRFVDGNLDAFQGVLSD